MKVHTQTRIDSIAKHQAILNDKTTIPFDFMIFAAGTSTVPCLENIDIEKNKKGQFKVDDYLRSETYHDIYIVGDSAALRDKKGKALPPTAQTAIQSGECAAKNIVCSIQNKPLKKANMQIKGIAIALGSRYAAIDLGYIHFCGYLAYLIKKLIERFI